MPHIAPERPYKPAHLRANKISGRNTNGRSSFELFF